VATRSPQEHQVRALPENERSRNTTVTPLVSAPALLSMRTSLVCHRMNHLNKLLNNLDFFLLALVL
jgi:hypothetical protein